MENCLQKRWRVLNMADISPHPDVLDPLKSVAEVTTLEPDEQVLLERIPEFDAYYASLEVRMNRQILAAASRLRAIATPSTGLDHIDVAFAAEHAIEVISLKEDTEFLDNITSTAEIAWALLLATVRRLPWAFEAAKAGYWARDRFRGHQISGKTLGILGYGRLGRMVAEYGKAFRMRVIACDVQNVTPAEGVELVDFDTLLRESDVLSLHIHLTEENRGLIDADAFARMKTGAILINTSRGAIIDEDAFLDALLSGHLGGAGLDVIVGEWDPDLKNHPLIRYANSHENLVISPHIGGVAYEAQRMAYTHAAEKLRQYLEEIDAEE